MTEVGANAPYSATIGEWDGDSGSIKAVNQGSPTMI